jgi:hypothetical protein
MNNPERDIQEILSKVRFDDAPDVRHRDALEQRLRATLSQAPRPPSVHAELWRTIMKSRFGKITAAAAVLAVVLGVSLWSSRSGSSNKVSPFTLLARASAAERVFFTGEHVSHIINEITLYPGPASDPSALLKDLETNATNEKNIAFIQSWLVQRWLPFYALGADGRTKEYKLDVAGETNKAVTLSDLVWYEPATSRFVRVLKDGDQVVFANAYDGEAVYVAQKDADGRLRVTREAVTGEFKMPDNPADFMGIAAGVRGSVPGEHFPPVQSVTTETRRDGAQLRAYKLGYADAWEKLNTYFLVQINVGTDVIDEMDCVVENATTRVYRRLAAENVDVAEFSWNLSELGAGAATQGKIEASVQANRGSEIITAAQMAERAPFAAYIFSTAPSWTHEGKLYDMPDEGSAPARMYSAIYKSKDGRDVVLTLGESFNRYFSTMLKAIEKAKQPIPWLYESSNGFKVIHQNDRNMEMWWTEVALKSAGFEPKANRIGYILMSPAKTFLVLAINGPISDEELHSVIDSLVPADKYVQP